MAVSKAQQKAVNKYMAANYDRINLTVPKGRKDSIQAHASAHGESVNGFIGRAIAEAMERDVDGPQEAVGPGVVSLPSETVKAAREAAQTSGEDVQQFVLRAVKTQAERDKAFLKMGINPTTGQKLEQSGKGDADHE